MRSSRTGPVRHVLRALGVAAALALPAAASAQTGTITGVVRDSAMGGPVEGAQVQLVGSDIGGLTASNGRYLLTNVPAGSYTLRVTHIAFEAEERPVSVAAGASTVLDVTMTSSAIELSELVVVGYGERRRVEVTSAIESLSSDEIREVPTASIDIAMQGKAAGVQVIQNSGNPGNAPTVRVRGSSSISASNQPLYVVDGVPILREDYSQLGMGGQNLSAITGLSPDEIETIDILKDAAAAAIYGSRGSNGVVLITTRRGRTGQPRVQFSVYGGFQQAESELDLLNASEYVAFMNESSTNEGGDPIYVPGVADRLNTDWQEAVLRTAPVANYAASVSGGVDRLRYFVSGSYFDQEGIVIASGYDRAAGRVNLDLGLSDRIDVRTSLAVSREDHERVQGDGSLYGVVSYAIAESPLVPVFRNNGDLTGPSDGLVYWNPVGLARMPTEALTLRSIGSGEVSAQLHDRFTLNGRAGFDLLTIRESQWQTPSVEGPYPSSVGGVSKSGFSQTSRYLAETYAAWNLPLPLTHDLTVTGGASVEMTDWELNFIRGEGFTSEDNHQINNAAVITDQSGNLGESNLVSVFSRGEWSLNDRYFATGSLRADASSRFGPNERWGIFPAVSAGWLLTAEDWFPELTALPLLRVRASWGETGNASIGDYPYQGLFGSANYGGVGGIAPSSIANPDLKWETTTETNLGFEAGLFSNRAVVTFDVYSKETSDLLLGRPITGTSGFTSVTANVGSMENRGWEASIETTNFEREDLLGGFRWTSRLNIAHNENEVTGLYNDQPFNTGERSINRVEVGQPLGAFHARRFLGVDPATGNAIFLDVNDDGAITDEDDRVIVGSPHPDYHGGLTNEIAAGPFDLRLFVSFSQGAEIFNAQRLFQDDGGYSADNKFGDVMDRWQEPGDITDTPRAGATSGSRILSSRFIEDASYVRIQELTLGFRIPQSVPTLGVSNARLFVSVNNLHTFTDYTGYSPDVNSNGSSATASLGTDFYAYPLARTVSFGINGEL